MIFYQYLNKFDHIEIPNYRDKDINITKSNGYVKQNIERVTIYCRVGLSKISKEQCDYYSKVKNDTLLIIIKQKPIKHKSTNCMSGFRQLLAKRFQKW